MTSAETPWAVVCPEHGKVCLSAEEYERQLCAANQRWRCLCGEEAQWDDDHYERHLQEEETPLPVGAPVCLTCFAPLPCIRHSPEL